MSRYTGNLKELSRFVTKLSTLHVLCSEMNAFIANSILFTRLGTWRFEVCSVRKNEAPPASNIRLFLTGMRERSFLTNRTNSVKDQGYGKRQVKGLSDSQCRRLGESQAIGSCIRKGRDSEGNGRQHLGGSKNQEAPPKVDIYVSR
jgi:hypothetical protein